MIKDLKENEKIINLFLVNYVTRGITNNGAAYLNITLQDSSGQIEGRKWEVTDSDLVSFVAGNIVQVHAEVIDYRGSMQLKVLSGTLVNRDEVDLTNFIPSAPVAREILQRRLAEYMAMIIDPEIRKVVDKIVKDNMVSFCLYPAASRNHHEYASGLLHHTVGMLDAANALLKVYPTLNADLLIGGIILHDIGKLTELSGPIIPKYTMQGRLLGHISIMNALLYETCQKLEISEETTTLLQHMVLSHHGELEFGSPVLPLLREAEVLHIIDNLDARINMIDKALGQISEGEFTAKIPSLEDRCFYKPYKAK